jgi:hypothetical protein
MAAPIPFVDMSHHVTTLLGTHANSADDEDDDDMVLCLFRFHVSFLL